VPPVLVILVDRFLPVAARGDMILSPWTLYS